MTGGSSRRAGRSSSRPWRSVGTAGFARRSRRPRRSGRPMATAHLTPTDPGLSIERVRSEFPILARRVHEQPIAYLDNGATAQKPAAVLEALDRFWREHNANVHSGVHTLSEEATALYERARTTIARHLGTDSREVVFTRNVTGALNLVAHAWGRANVGAGDRIVLTEMEHHSNVVPWYLLARDVGAELDWVPVDGEGRLDLESLASAFRRGPKLRSEEHTYELQSLRH